MLLLIGISCERKAESNTQFIPLQDSIPYFDKLIQANPKSDSIFFRKGIYLLQQNQADSGIVLLEHAIALNPDNTKYYFSLSDAYLLGIESKKAEGILDSVLGRYPNNIEAMLKKARLQLILNKHLNAMAILDQVFGLDPQNAEANYIAGHVFYEQGDTGRAVKCYQKSVDLNPEYVEGWIQLGDVMLNLKNKRCLDYYRNAIKIDSNNIETLHNYAYSLQLFGKKEEAIQLYKENIQKEPEYELSYYNLGLLYQEMDSCLQALVFLDRAIEINGNEASSYYHRAKCYVTSGQTTRAKSDLLTALKIFPEYKDAQKLLKQLGG